MNKRQLMDEIRRHNTSVPEEFLAQFDDQALQQYLDHLQGALKRRSVIHSFVRKQPRLKMAS